MIIRGEKKLLATPRHIITFMVVCPTVRGYGLVARVFLRQVFYYVCPGVDQRLIVFNYLGIHFYKRSIRCMASLPGSGPAVRQAGSQKFLTAGLTGDPTKYLQRRKEKLISSHVPHTLLPRAALSGKCFPPQLGKYPMLLSIIPFTFLNSLHNSFHNRPITALRATNHSVPLDPTCIFRLLNMPVRRFDSAPFGLFLTCFASK